MATDPELIAASILVDYLGGTTAVALSLGIKPPSVSDWRKNGIPRSRVLELALVHGCHVYSRDDLAFARWHFIWPGLPAASPAEPRPHSS